MPISENANTAYVKSQKFHNTVNPMTPPGQYSSGRVTCGVDATLGKVWVYNASGLGQVDALTSTAFSILTLPTNISPASTAAKVVTYIPTTGVNSGVKLMFLVSWNTSTSRYEVYSAAPGLKSVAPTWSSLILQMQANATLIPTAVRACSTGVFIGEYTGTPDISGNVKVYKIGNDGSTVTTVLSLTAGSGGTRHIHGIYEDPFNLGTIYVTIGDFFSPYTPSFAVYKSTDGGNTFTGVATLASSSWQAVSMGFTASWVYFASDQSQGGGAYICDRATMTPRWLTTKPRPAEIAVPGGAGGRSVSDLSTVNGATAVASPTAAFVSALDVGRWVRGPNTVPLGTYITAVPSTTIAAGSNAAVLPQASISVASTASLQSSGVVAINTSLGVQTVTYTGVSGGVTLTGCTGGTGTLSTGGSVVQAVLSQAATGTITTTAQIASDSFYVSAYAGATDPASGYFYIAANDASNAGNTAGVFYTPAPDEPWTLLWTIPFAQIGNHEVFIAGGYLWVDRYGPMPVLTAS